MGRPRAAVRSTTPPLGAEQPPEQPRHLALTLRQVDYWLTVYKRTWRGSVVNSFVTPLLYLMAMGWLLGGYVDASRPDLGGAPSYLLFVAPGLLAAHAMQTAMGEVLWPVMSMLKWNKTYFAMIATPLRVQDIVGAHLAFVGFRIATTCAVFMLVLAPFGAYASVAGVVLAFAAQLLIGLAFAAPFLGVAALAKSDSLFSVIFRVVVTPLFLFSGAFFPVANLTPALQWAARATPLFHGVELTRAFMLTPLRDVDWGAMAGHTAYLLVLLAAGSWWAVSRLRRKLIS